MGGAQHGGCATSWAAMAQPNLSAQLRPNVGPLALLLSSIGLKAVMAVTGLGMAVFLIGHTAGNLQIFLGREVYNDYAAFLHSLGSLLWIARLGLLGAVTLHILAAAKLTSENLAAREGRYAVKHHAVTNYAARTMAVSGPILALFIIYHIAHLTLGVTPGDYTHSETDVYSNFVRGFQIPWVAWFYALANLALGLHLFHGLWSMFQTLGINHASYNTLLKCVAIVITLFVAGGNIFMPLAVLSGAVVL